MGRFGFETTGDEVVRHFADKVQGRTCPTEGGIGGECAKCLALGRPACMVLMGRSRSRCQSVIDGIKSISPETNVIFVVVNLASFASVREAARTVLQDDRIGQIDVMINNAGVMAVKTHTLTEDGHELQLQVNYLGHFLLTNKLIPKLGGCRLVVVSSNANKVSGIHWDDPDFKNGGYEPWEAYGQSKTALILFAVAVNKTTTNKKIHAYAVHPGAVMTNLQRDSDPDELKHAAAKAKERFGEEAAKELFRWKTLGQAAATPLVAALDPDLDGDVDAVWLADCQTSVESLHFEPRAKDPIDAERLWGMSEEMVGETFS